MDSEGDVARFRFSLRGLLLVTAFIAAMVAPISWLGEIYAASLAVSLLMLGLVSIALCRRSTILAAVACLSGLIPIPAFLAGVFFSPAAALQMILTPVAVIATHPWRTRPGIRVLACASVMAVIYGVTLWGASDNFQRVMDLRVAYPAVSIADRLPEQTAMRPVALTDEQRRRFSTVTSACVEPGGQTC